MSKHKPSAAARTILSSLIDSIVRLAVYCGFSKADLVEAIVHSFSDLDVTASSIRHDPSVEPAEKDFLGGLLATWWSDPACVDDTGTPKPLPMAGPVSIESLCERMGRKHKNAAASMSAEAAVKRLIESKAVETRGDEYVVKSKFFRIVSQDAVFALNQLSYLSDYAQTAEINTFQPEDGIFQRVAHTPRFDRSKLPLLKRMVDEQGMGLLTAMDRMMESESSTVEARRGDDVHAGVGVYLFIRH